MMSKTWTFSYFNENHPTTGQCGCLPVRSLTDSLRGGADLRALRQRHLRPVREAGGEVWGVGHQWGDRGAP